ncbi:hypothetical protein BGZ76_002765 [Entomortierella beljakovae]|nr:hypothetical protein BGZ76_002765 [Entomortierella beljakovae]
MRLSPSSAVPISAVPISAKEFAKWLIPFQSQLTNQQNRLTFSKSKEQHDTIKLNRYANVNSSSKPHFFEHHLEPVRNIGIAVSGGVDSMALATLLAGYYRDCKTVNLHALIVDHKLRDDSTEEANFVAALVEKLNVIPHVLTLNWGAPRSKNFQTTPDYTSDTSIHKPDKIHLETKARLERYKAIAKRCYSLQINDLYVGHHEGDQIETVVFRLTRASGIDGLSGIQKVAPLGVLNVVEGLDIRVIRPLLSVSKERLRATCEGEGTQWVEDPSNRSLDYQRNVIRHYQHDLDSKVRINPNSRLEPLSTTAMLEFRERMDQHRQFVWDQVRPWLNSIIFDTRNGVCHVKLQTTDSTALKNIEWLSESHNHIATRLISFIVRWVNCKDHNPRLEDVQILLGRLRSTISMAPSDIKINTNTFEHKSPSTSTVHKRKRERVSKHIQSSSNAGIDPNVSRESEMSGFHAVNIAGVLFSPPRTSKGIPQHWTLSRQPMSTAERLATSVYVVPEYDNMTGDRDGGDEKSVLADLLWDQRFFIRVEHSHFLRQNGNNQPPSQIHVRMLGADDVATIRQILQSQTKGGQEETKKSYLFKKGQPD